MKFSCMRNDFGKLVPHMKEQIQNRRLHVLGQDDI